MSDTPTVFRRPMPIGSRWVCPRPGCWPQKCPVVTAACSPDAQPRNRRSSQPQPLLAGRAGSGALKTEGAGERAGLGSPPPRPPRPLGTARRLPAREPEGTRASRVPRKRIPAGGWRAGSPRREGHSRSPPKARRAHDAFRSPARNHSPLKSPLNSPLLHFPWTPMSVRFSTHHVMRFNYSILSGIYIVLYCMMKNTTPPFK